MIYINPFLNIFKVLLIAYVEIEKGKPPLNPSLIQWYDFKSQIQPYCYGCSRLQLKELYNFIKIKII